MPRAKKNGPIRRSKAAKLVQAISEYVPAHLDSDLDERTVAALFRTSPSTIRYAFGLQGLQYHQYVEAQRMKEARRLIEEERLFVKEAMYATGYRSRSTFSRAFKRYFGKNPSDFQ